MNGFKGHACRCEHFLFLLGALMPDDYYSVAMILKNMGLIEVIPSFTSFHQAVR